jgi:type IV pilus assembly protein PilX
MLIRRPRTLGMQRGAALIFALIVLVTMLLAGAALMRSVDTSVVIAGNLALKQATTASGETGVEAAIAWLEANKTGATLHTSIPDSGYMAAEQHPNVNQSWDSFWIGALAPAHQIVTLPADTTDNRVSYVIHRLCNDTGPPTSVGAHCSTPPSVISSGNSKGAGIINPIASTQVYYRITARIDGPRNTLSYVQVIVAM